jgi:hypothetical protein
VPKIANSLDSFKNIVSIVHQISKNRTNIVDLEKPPITDKEKKTHSEKLKSKIPDAEI